ncbi:DUF1002 domain-containing protein [Blautia sp. MSJ-19]|uniref:DUF1002 domain-containing protein n=1 Tax=Blautia sp. MSJ-19 TaxID=2841517 RepID=UPI00209DADD3|nr:DUF1002 domain-containing protein [Blautia sp. MSJ-19]
MKKRNIIVAMLCSMCLAVSTPIPAMADATKVVTLGADLTEDQKNTMMNYFKADSSQVQIITVTNQDEHNLLGKYIPSAQIGTRTLSCAYVKPTQSGGIKVRTANLNYVTCNMIATALSTAGVNNCEVVAACPYEVSGTGALTGVMKAYESASGQELDSTKKDLAAKEVVVTGDVGQQVGQDNATNIINQAKMQIIGDNIQNADEIYNIVNNIAVQNGVSLSQDELDTIVSLLQQIAQQNYDIQEMKQTLENIQQNLEQTKAQEEGQPTPTPIESDVADEGNDGDDITANVDSGALGDVKETSTEDPGLAEQTGADTNNAGSSENTDGSDESGIPEATEDGTVVDEGSDTDATETPDESADSSNEENTDSSTDQIPEATEDGSESADNADTADTETPDESTSEDSDSTDASEESGEDTLNTDALSEDDKAKFQQAQQFCQGEYEGDLAVLQGVVADVTELPVTLDAETGSKLTKKVLEGYLEILNDGGATYVPADTDMYLTTALNMLNAELKTVFSIETEPAADDILVNVDAETRQKLYSDTMKFFEKLYGEEAETSSDEGTTQENTEETSGEENTEEAY